MTLWFVCVRACVRVCTCECACAFLCVRVCVYVVCMCVRECVRTCVRARVCTPCSYVMKNLPKYVPNVARSSHAKTFGIVEKKGVVIDYIRYTIQRTFVCDEYVSSINYVNFLFCHFV